MPERARHRRLVPSHFSMRYVFDRACALSYEWTHLSAPWLTRQAIRRIEAWLRPSFAGLEWGAGRSTVWLARRVARLTSIEHDPAWFDRVHADLARRGLSNVSLRLADADSAEYLSAANDMADDSLDFALVDGVSARRDACALTILPKIRPGGMLIVDDIHRYLPSRSRSPLALAPHSRPLTPLWEELACRLGDWTPIWTSDGVRDTVLWERPGR